MAESHDSGTAPSRNDADHTTEHCGDDTAPTITELADRLNRGWEWFFVADAMRTDAFPDGAERQSIFDDRHDISRQIADTVPRNLQETLIRAAIFSEFLEEFAEEARKAINSAVQAFGDVLAHAQAEGINLHPATRAYFLPKRDGRTGK